ncbi:hypothetical protein [Halovenus marina]|uniref:hypothetical protein n=1 Tax=Halovenus marina TaxID=3396621 RepID=UPI003F577540
MRRRSFLATVGTVGTATVSGCLGETVLQEINGKTIRVEPQQGWVEQIESVGGTGEISYTVRSENQRFQVFYFHNQSDYDQYEQFRQGEMPENQPEGHPDLSGIAVSDEQRGIYEATVPQGGGRMDVTIEETHYFVVDYSNYGLGPTVDEHDDTLRATVNLEIVETSFL